MTRLAPRQRPAFAMLMALLVVVVTTIGVMALVQRQMTQTLSAQRLIDQYQLHHGVRGLEEVLSSWLLTLSQLNVQQVLEADPEAMSIVLGDGTVVSIILTDGQGLARRNSLGLTSGMIAAAQAISEELEIQVNDRSRFLELTREKGPVGVSQNTAPIEVLRAVAAVVLPEGDYQALAARWDAARQTERLTVAKARELALDAGARDNRAGMLNSLFVDIPAVWRMDISVREGQSPNSRGQVVALYTGLVQLVQTASVQSGSRILDFRPIDPEDLRAEMERRAATGRLR